MKRVFAGMILAFLLAACGGGGGGAISTTPDESEGGQGGKPESSQKRECKSGDVVLATASCLEDCADDEELRGEICAELGCKLGTATNHECPAVKDCPAGSVALRVLESETCMRDCAVVGLRPASTACPAVRTCRNGDEILATAVCMQTCVSGEKIPESERCMQDCPAGSVALRILESETCMRDCPVVGLRPASTACPAVKTCGNGDEILATAVCMQTCVSGEKIPESERCMKNCPAGSVASRILESETCMRDCPVVGLRPASQGCPAVKTCDNGNEILATALCLEDCADDEELRGEACAELECELGTATNHECPAVQDCPAGSAALRILESETCMRDCPVVGLRPASQGCPAVKTCDNGNEILSTAFCLEDCADDEELRGEVCAELECELGTATNHECPAVKNCPAGSTASRILESETCMRDCAVVGLRPASQDCPAVKTCDNGDEILSTALCLEDCADDEELRGEICAELECELGTATNHECPAVKNCPTGSVALRILESETCMCKSGYEQAEGGACLPVSSRFDTPEYRANEYLDLINPLYAYERGHNGKGVTIAVHDNCFVETHQDLSANIVATDIHVPLPFDRTRNTRAAVCSERSSHFHGTGVAGVAAGARNDFEAHGVAPEAKIYPAYGAGDAYPRIELTRHIQIANYSSGVLSFAPYTNLMALSVRLTSTLSYNAPLLNRWSAMDDDTVVVWAAGNDGRNHVQENGLLIQPAVQPHYPLFDKDLENNWLVVVGVRRAGDSLEISPSSNGCGVTRDWCVAAPFSAYIPWGPENDGYRLDGGTSFSAPYVSGALALLKSAAPAMPIVAIKAILLTTARDIGEEGIDELYGWGMVNVSAGIAHIENMETAETQGLPGVNLQAFRSGLPDGFRHLSADMKDISVAVEVTENSFVNIPLSDLLLQTANSAPAIGGAAGEMSAAGAEEKWRPGFAAFADSSQGAYKLSWTGGAGKTQIGGELLHYAEDETFTGMGALGGASGKQSGGKIRMKRGLFGGFSAFGEYEYAEIKAKAESGGLLSEIRGAELEGWSAGMEFADMWRKGGRLILSAKQAKGLSGGEMIIRRPLAEGEFYDAFLGESEQRIVERESSLGLQSDIPLIWTAGYTIETAKGNWSAAAEHAQGNTAISAQWKIDL